MAKRSLPFFFTIDNYFQNLSLESEDNFGTHMLRKNIPAGVVHELPPDLCRALAADAKVLRLWVSLTPLARNEFICWVEDAKLAATRTRRIRRTREELESGLRRPCCWPGCKHRGRQGRGTPSQTKGGLRGLKKPSVALARLSAGSRG